MTDAVDGLPLARWDGIHLVLNLAPVVAHLRRRLERPGGLEDLGLSGSGDRLRVEGVIPWLGARTRIVAELGELRLRSRRLGLRVLRVTALAGVPIPRWIVLSVLQRRYPDLITVLPGSGIVVVDLRRWLPAELALRILTVQVTDHFLHLWVGPGSLHDLPGDRERALPAETAPAVGSESADS